MFLIHLKKRYQNNLELMKSSECFFPKCKMFIHKINPNYGGLYVILLTG